MSAPPRTCRATEQLRQRQERQAVRHQQRRSQAWLLHVKQGWQQQGRHHCSFSQAVQAVQVQMFQVAATDQHSDHGGEADHVEAEDERQARRPGRVGDGLAAAVGLQLSGGWRRRRRKLHRRKLEHRSVTAAERKLLGRARRIGKFAGRCDGLQTTVARV